MTSCGSNTYGIHKETHERVHIGAAINGLKCNCMCPACQNDLIARNNGKKRLPHFAHASGTACNWAGETDVHLMAKEILSQKKCLCFPPYKGELHCVNLAMQDFELVTCEPFIDGRRPDCVGVWKDDNGREIEIWVEITVTHSVVADNDKMELIKVKGINCIEINLKQFANLHELTDEFEVAVLESAERVWANAPFLDEIDRAKVEEANRARQARNDELRVKVAHELKEKFDSSRFFEILIPCLNVCEHRDKCACVEAKDCMARGQRMLNMKGYYDLCDVLPSNTDNKVIELRHSIKPVKPLYIAVYGEGEKFPKNMDGKVIAVRMKSPHDMRPLENLDFSYHMDCYPEEYEEEDDYYPSKRYYNLVEKDRGIEWNNEFYMNSFVLHRSGKWIIKDILCKEQFATDKKAVFQKAFQFKHFPLFSKHLYGIALAIETGHKVKHCSICKYHKQSLGNKVEGCTKPEVGSKIDWSALFCAHFERNDELIQNVKENQPQLYKSM